MIFDKNTLKLLRIPFSFYLMPVFLFALSQAREVSFMKTFMVFMILHLFIYPASNGYNSFMDRDEGSIGGLKNPPPVTSGLFYASMIFDVAGLSLSFLVSPVFLLLVLLYVIASRAYSFRGIRLKKYPVVGFLTVVFFQGAFTWFMVTVGISNQEIGSFLSGGRIYPLAACSFLIGGVYPLTQIYQHREDLENGDISISYLLGYKGTFLFSGVMFAMANVLLWLYFRETGKSLHFFLLSIFLTPVAAYLIKWYLKVRKDISEASFENTMRMNGIASVCMNTCFSILFLLNNLF